NPWGPRSGAPKDRVRRAPAHPARGLLLLRRSLRELPPHRAVSTTHQHPEGDANMLLLQTVRPNIVQAIRAFRVEDLQQAAQDLGQHFLYANLGNAQSKQDVLEAIAEAFLFPSHFGKNLDALYDCMTDLVHKSGAQPGFIVVLEQLPDNVKFDR